MNPDQLLAFLAVERTGGFTRAAEELFLSQSAVTRRVQQLEASVGVDLFERIGRTVRLTDAGRRLAAEGPALLGHADRVEEQVRLAGKGKAGRLRIGASTTPGLYLLPGLVAAYRRDHLPVAVEFSIEDSLAIERGILENRLDVGFVGAHLAHGDLELTAVATDEIVCLAGPEHRLAGRRRVRPRDLAGEVFVLRPPGSATRRIYLERLRAAGVEVRTTVPARTPEAVRALVRAGLGISFLSRHAIAAEVGAGRLAEFRVQGVDGRRPIFLALHREKHLSPAVRDFVTLTETTVKQR